MFTGIIRAIIGSKFQIDPITVTFFLGPGQKAPLPPSPSPLPPPPSGSWRNLNAVGSRDNCEEWFQHSCQELETEDFSEIGRRSRKFLLSRVKTSDSNIYVLYAQFLGQKMLFRANEITLQSCDTMAGNLIELCVAEVSFWLCPGLSGQNEARTNMADCCAENLNKSWT